MFEKYVQRPYPTLALRYDGSEETRKFLTSYFATSKRHKFSEYMWEDSIRFLLNDDPVIEGDWVIVEEEKPDRPILINDSHFRRAYIKDINRAGDIYRDRSMFDRFVQKPKRVLALRYDGTPENKRFLEVYFRDSTSDIPNELTWRGETSFRLGDKILDAGMWVVVRKTHTSILGDHHFKSVYLKDEMPDG